MTRRIKMSDPDGARMADLSIKIAVLTNSGPAILGDQESNELLTKYRAEMQALIDAAEDGRPGWLARAARFLRRLARIE